MTKKLVQPPIKPFITWALSNWGTPRGTYRTRQLAIKEAKDASGEPWVKCRNYYKVTKVQVTPL